MVWQKGNKLQGGRYVIEKVLGEGGFGITYQAQHTLLKQWVVIKTPNESLKNDSEYPNYVKRFIQEGRKLGKLSQQPHPNIVRVNELFEESKTYCLVMDFVPGESLFNLVQKRGALPELEAVGYIKQIGEALIFVHQQGLVHRDAHPGNIMVQKNGKAVLIDFGIAGEIMPQDGYFTSHHPANIAFAPYEQMGGNRQVTIDVYTLAAPLYYAVTGKRPESSLDRKLYNKPLISPNKYVVGISDSLNLAILKAMNLEAENRPQSMREWLKLLPDFSNQVYQISQKIEHQTIRTEKTVPVIVGVNNSPSVKVNSKNIPWVQLGFIGFYYLVHGFLLGSFYLKNYEELLFVLMTNLVPPLALAIQAIPSDESKSLGVAFSHIVFMCCMFLSLTTVGTAIFLYRTRVISDNIFFGIVFNMFFFALCFMTSDGKWVLPLNLHLLIFLLCVGLLGIYYSWVSALVSIGFAVIHILIYFAYASAGEKLIQSFTTWERYQYLLIRISPSSIGIFLGWLIYQFFPIFANR